jgi:hypothetical protein
MRQAVLTVMLMAATASILNAQEQAEFRAYADSVVQLGDRALGYHAQGRTQYLSTGVEAVQLAARFAAVEPPEALLDLHRRMAKAAERYVREEQKTGAIPQVGIDQCWSRHYASVSQTCGSVVNSADPPSKLANAAAGTAAQTYVMARRELKARLLEHGVKLKPE